MPVTCPETYETEKGALRCQRPVNRYPHKHHIWVKPMANHGEMTVKWWSEAEERAARAQRMVEA